YYNYNKNKYAQRTVRLSGLFVVYDLLLSQILTQIVKATNILHLTPIHNKALRNTAWKRKSHIFHYSEQLIPVRDTFFCSVALIVDIAVFIFFLSHVKQHLSFSAIAAFLS